VALEKIIGGTTRSREHQHDGDLISPGNVGDPTSETGSLDETLNQNSSRRVANACC
jgi:hypothetical protein